MSDYLNSIQTKYLILKGEDYSFIENDGRYTPEYYESYYQGMLYVFWSFFQDVGVQYFIDLLNDQSSQGLLTEFGKLKEKENQKISISTRSFEDLPGAEYTFEKENLIHILEKMKKFIVFKADEIILKRTGNVLDAEAIWYKEVHE